MAIMANTHGPQLSVTAIVEFATAAEARGLLIPSPTTVTEVMAITMVVELLTLAVLSGDWASDQLMLNLRLMPKLTLITMDLDITDMVLVFMVMVLLDILVQPLLSHTGREFIQVIQVEGLGALGSRNNDIL